MIPTIGKSRAALLNRERLVDAKSCEVSKSSGGEYCLKLQYPTNGVHAERLTLLNQINAITSRADRKEQPFVITKIQQDISGVITVTAYHKTYALANYPIKAFDEQLRTPQEAIDALSVNSPASFNGLSVSAEEWEERQLFGLKKATNWREALFGSGGFLDVYGGVLIADGNKMIWRNNSGVGFTRGTVRYGLNLTKFKRIYDVSDTYSHAYVFWTDGETLVECPDLVCLGENEEFIASTVLDLSEYFEDVPNTSQLAEKAKKFSQKNGLTDIDVTMNIAFIPLRLTEEYKDMTWIEEVDLFDFVKVEVPMFGQSSLARITATNFDVLAENYKSITVGTLRRTFATTLARLI